MRKLAIAAALIASTMSAEAGQRNYQHYPQQYYHHHHNNNNGAVFGGFVGGLIIGGMLINQQPQYYYQPVCQNVFVGNYWNGFRWVRQYQVICN